VLKAGRRTISIVSCTVLLAACGGGGGDDDDGGFSNPPGFTIGGTVSGLTGTGLVLQNNAGNNLTVGANGNFTFTQSLQTGATYNVTVSAQPTNPSQTCSITGGSGTVASAAITSVNVTCTGQVGKFLYVPNPGSDNVSAYAINANTGALTAVAGSPFATGEAPFFAGTDAASKWLYVSNAGSISDSPTLSGYAINSTTGALTEFANSPFDLSTPPPAPTAPGNLPVIGDLLIHPSTTFGYIVRPQPGQLFGATIDANGNLTEIPNMPAAPGVVLGNPVFNAGNTALWIPHITDAGTLAGAVAMYSVANNGALTPMGSVVTGGQAPTFAALETSGKFLMVPNTFSGTLAVFAVNPANATLQAVAGSPFTTNGTRIGGLALHPSKNFVYVTNSNNAASGTPSSVAGFTYDTTTGVLTPMPGSPFSSGGVLANLAAIDPTGKFLYVVNRDSDNVQGFAINETSGVLTPVPGSPFNTGDFPFAVAIDPSGRYLYIPNTSSGTVSSYAINPTSGVLTLVTTLAAGVSPSLAEVVGRQ
jgi:6-phosphogluconolactonase